MAFFHIRKAFALLLVFSLIAGFIVPTFSHPKHTALAAPPISAPKAPPNPPVYPSNCTGSFAHIYNVGTGQPYTSIGAVPFSSLQPSSIVRIHYRATPYYEKVFVNTIATANQPVCIVGVPGPNGELPIIDGQNATTSANMETHYDGSQQRGLFTIIGADDGLLPAYIYVEGLHFRNAYQDYTFTAKNGTVRNYTTNAAAVYVQRGEHIRITGCIISGSGNGLFAATDDDGNITRDLTLEYSYVYGNGVVGRDREHNTYTESIGMVYQYNYFSALRTGSMGANIKDRSSGTIVRYNWVDGGAIVVDLVESEYGWPVLSQQPNYHQAWVYGNVLINRPTSSANGRSTVHFGGDNGGDTPIPGTQPCGWDAGQDPTDCYRKGPLYFFNNTVILHVSSGHKTLLRLQTDEQYATAYNNIVHVVGTGYNISYMSYRGQLNLGLNIVNRNSSPLTDFHLNQPGPASTVVGHTNVTVFTNPTQTGFVNANAENFYLLPTSPAINNGTPILSPSLPVTNEYHTTLGARVRNNDGALDMGAFEYTPSLAMDTLAVFNPNSEAASLINTLQDSPPPSANLNFSPTPPAAVVNGQWVMGDWDGNGQKSPGVYAPNGVFYFTNVVGTTTSWNGIWFGLFNKPAVVGRFNAGINRDCFGVVDNANFPPYGMAFALYFTCDNAGGDPPKTFQWLSVLLPDNQGFSGAFQFTSGDFDGNGVDSIAVRRGPFIAWTNVPPTTLESAFSLAQYIGAPSSVDYGVVLSGDWDGNGLDSFGLFYQDGSFYRRTDLEWNTGRYLLQRVGVPIGTPTNATSWRGHTGGTGGSSGGDAGADSPSTQTPLGLVGHIEAESPDVTKQGSWTTQSAPTASGGQYVFSSDLSGALTLSFEGTSVEIAYLEGPAFGTFTVLIDDVAVRTVIATNATAGHASTVVNYLTDEVHTLQIVPIDGTIAVDAFEVAE
ncbi:MAG: hypothetical protein K8L91_19950 [Anaerolineae bacterium]|nr:hypothetical protein [Anaerolineae bacterium]